jgi:hypothetical protein
MNASFSPRDIRSWFRSHFLFNLILACVVGAFSSSCIWAQTLETAPATLEAALPNAPDPQGTASLSGTVVDQNGAAVRDAVVTVSAENGSPHLTATTNRHGAFHFAALPPGNYTVVVSGAGIQSMTPQPLLLAAGQPREFPVSVTRVPHVTATVRVTASPVQIATAQVHVEEQQRVFAVIPNFYTSFAWDAAPMTPRLKFHLAARATFDPFALLTDAAIAGAEQYHDTYPGYGAGWPGYGKRFGATVADSFDSRIIGGALLPSLFHQDPRYFYRGKGSVLTRLGYALGQAVLCRGDQGGQEVNYSRIGGAFIAAGISNVYHSSEDRSASITIRDAFVILGGAAGENVLREFLSRGLTSHVPPNANGKP